MRRTLLFMILALAATVAVPAAHASASTTWADFNGDGFGDASFGLPDVNSAGQSRSGAVQVVYGSASGLDASTALFLSSASFGITPKPHDTFGWAVSSGDYDGDGYDDLAIGIPQYDRPPSEGSTTPNYDAGAVVVVYGSATGLDLTDTDLWHQDVGTVIGTALRGDRFGYSLASADFDDDGRDDLAVGVPMENIIRGDGTKARDAGMVNLIYGSADGLTDTGNQNWHQARPGIEGAVENFDNFGLTLGVGDLNGDGAADLAAGVPTENIGNMYGAGAVNVIYGSAAGLTATGDQIWWQNAPDVEGKSQTGDSFGRALSAGDFDADGDDDLAVGVPNEYDDPRIPWTGIVQVFYGTAGTGLTSADDAVFDQSTEGVPGDPEDYDSFGASLAAADIDGDGFDDLAVGAPGEAVGIASYSGAVNVLFGDATGLTASGALFVAQGRDDLPGTSESNDNFAAALAGGDFDGNGFADLLIGVPLESTGSTDYHGAVYEVPGSATGPDRAAATVFDASDFGRPLLADEQWGKSLDG